MHFILGKANKDRPNGVNQVIAGLCKYSARNGAQIRVIGLANSVDYEGQVINRDGFSVRVYSKWSRKLLDDIKGELAWCDFLHIHGVYNIYNILVSKIASRCSVPYIVTIHDGLSPIRAAAKRTALKWIFTKILIRTHLESAIALHVLTNEESTDVIAVCEPKNLILVPNGIDIDDYPYLSTFSDTPAVKSCLILGYLGRISSEKNLLSLVRAVKSLEGEYKIKLKIAGPKSPYLDEIIEQDIDEIIEWVGPKYGNDKVNFIRSLDLFIHPSLCDVFSIVAMEVLTIGTPLLITRTSNSSYFYNRNAFFMCEPTSFGLRNGIIDALRRKDEWPMIVKNGRSLIESTFNWDSASKSLLAECSRLLLKAK